MDHFCPPFDFDLLFKKIQKRERLEMIHIDKSRRARQCDGQIEQYKSECW